MASINNNSDDVEEKTPRNHAGGDTPAASGGRSSTLLVTGARITEEVIRRLLATYEPFTYIQEPDDDKVFLTFDSVEIVSHAQTALEGCEEGWRVTIARRPPSTGAWAPAASPRNPPPPKDVKRTLLTYDDIFD